MAAIRIKSFEYSPDFGAMLIRFEHGGIARLDLKKLALRGPVFAPLADPEYARQAQILGNGDVLGWPGELDLCADSIWDKYSLGKKVKPESKSA